MAAMCATPQKIDIEQNVAFCGLLIASSGLTNPLISSITKNQVKLK